MCRSVPGLLMVNFEYGPECLNLPFALMVLSLGLSHLPLQLLQGRLNQPESVSYPHEQICKRGVTYSQPSGGGFLFCLRTLGIFNLLNVSEIANCVNCKIYSRPCK